jgi:sarcosine oxidase subunit gamma
VAESAFAGCAPVLPTREGAAAHPVEPLSLVSVTVWHGEDTALAHLAKTTFALDLPQAGRWTHAGDIIAIWIGPGHWWLQGALLRDLTPLAAHAGLIDLSDARAMLRIYGPEDRDMLASLLPIDLHPRGFAPGRAASTVAGHIAVHIRQLDTVPTYDLSCARSYAGSLWRALEMAGNGRIRLDLAERPAEAVSPH